MENSVQILISGDTDKAPYALRDFLNACTQTFDFPELNERNYRADLWKALFGFCSGQHVELHRDCLSTVRVLSRDKSNLNELVDNDWTNLLLYHTGLKGDKNLHEGSNNEVAVEGLKCLCNIIFNATVPRALCCRNGIVEGIVNRIRSYRETKVILEIRFFDMKILFLITALCSEIRPKLKDELHGLTYLIESLDLMVKELHEDDHNSDMHDDQNDCKLSDMQVNFACEVLKTLFNISIRPSLHSTIDKEEEAHYLRLVDVLHELLLVDVQTREKKLELDNNVVNLLTNMPDQCLKQLVTPVQSGQSVPKHMQFEEQNMSAVHEILQFLHSRFGVEPGVSNQNEVLSPVLTVLLKFATSSRAMRKYLRLQILPPLRDVHNRPEQGVTLRNCLCRLLTTPITLVRELTAELLFVLCKENAGRMIKYTGYGNAAGMFAARGLLVGKNQTKPPHLIENDEASIYSSDSGDSETEEYSEYKHGINPVMGCYQPSRPSATAHMTEEQKEYEAMKLVELMNNLTKHGIVKPCTIGKDGRPEPIEHVLQMQEGLPNQQVRMDDESD